MGNISVEISASSTNKYWQFSTRLSGVTLSLSQCRECTAKDHGLGFDSQQKLDSSILRSLQTGSGAHPTSYPMCTGAAFAGGKEVRTWNWSLTSNYYRGKEWWSYNSTPLCAFKVRSQWSRGLRNEMSSPTRTFGSWFRIPLKVWMLVCVYYLCVGLRR
jgi:hypothetical protein